MSPLNHGNHGVKALNQCQIVTWIFDQMTKVFCLMTDKLLRYVRDKGELYEQES
jgi:hypothetical protein